MQSNILRQSSKNSINLQPGIMYCCIIQVTAQNKLSNGPTGKQMQSDQLNPVKETLVINFIKFKLTEKSITIQKDSVI